MKKYISLHAPRTIPVGYSAADVRETLADTWRYVSCEIEENDLSRSDFFGLNSYSWCGDSSYTASGYDKLVSQFKSTSIPIFFSAYGCNAKTPRKFTEVQSLYGDKMNHVIGGGLVYEYSQEASNYGLVSLNDNNTASICIDYDNLKRQYSKLDTDALQFLNTNSSKIKPYKCAPDLINTPKFPKSFDLPEIPPGGNELIKNGIQKPNRGRIVDVKSTKISSTVYDSSGKEIKNLSLKILGEGGINKPDGTPSGPSTTSASSPSATETHTSETPSPSSSGDGQSAAYKPRVVFKTVSALLITAMSAVMWT